MRVEDAASKLSELGHTSRLGIYRLLVKAGHNGMSVSEIQDDLDIPGSTLSHHLARLVRTGLVTQTREGRVLRCQAQFDELTKLIEFLESECCSGN